MDPLLGPSWLEGTETAVVELRDEASVALVREAVRAASAVGGIDAERAEGLVTAASEIAHNHLRHAGGGVMAVRPTSRLGTAGVEVLGRDAGPGISDPAAALAGRDGDAVLGRDGGGGLGVGLAGALRLADEVDFDVRRGEGTTIALRRFARPLPRSEVAIVGRPRAGERLMGDDAAWRRTDRAVLALVADGLGHGLPARAAAGALPPLVRQRPGASLEELHRASHEALAGTRGAVMALARIDLGTSEIEHLGVGNVEALVAAPAADTRRFSSTPGVLGVRAGTPEVRGPAASRMPLPPRAVLVMFTDGLSTRLDPATEPALLRERPIVIAQRLLSTHGKDHDDALVLVVK